MIKDTIIKHVVAQTLKSGSLSIAMLEKQYNKIKKDLESKDVTKLSEEELRSVLAYEFLKDGAEHDFIEQIWKGKDPAYKSKTNLLKQLEHFGY